MTLLRLRLLPHNSLEKGRGDYNVASEIVRRTPVKCDALVFDVQVILPVRLSAFPKNWNQLIAVRYWNQLIAATGTNYLPQVHNNRAISDLQYSATFRILEPAIAESANWKLNLAESSD